MVCHKCKQPICEILLLTSTVRECGCNGMPLVPAKTINEKPVEEWRTLHEIYAEIKSFPFEVKGKNNCGISEKYWNGPNGGLIVEALDINRPKTFFTDYISVGTRYRTDWVGANEKRWKLA